MLKINRCFIKKPLKVLCYKIEHSFYLRENVVDLAKDLLGKYLFTNIDGFICGGMITETEAYEGVTDKASHAYGGRRSKRTEVMYKEGGVAYVYLCYGIHSLFNVVTNGENVPHAILIRALDPEIGVERMIKRTGKLKANPDLTNGPGKLSKALGIHYMHSGTDLTGGMIWLEDRGINISNENIIITKRIGVDYAAEDAGLPYRFIVK